MSGQQSLPLELDPFRMAELGRHFTGNVALKVFKRLIPLLESTTGSIDVELKFGVDEDGIYTLHGTLDTMLVLKCQRCLMAMNFPLQNKFQLALVKSDSEAGQLPERYEAQIVETTPMRIMDMLEDEILLSIPHIPMHNKASCSTQPFRDENNLAEQQQEKVKPNPFAVLEKLKKNH